MIVEEEISIREIIETVWNGKYFIIVITVLAMILSGFFSFLVLNPVYETASLVRSINKHTTEDTNSNNDLNSFAETIKSNSSMNRVLEKLKLDRTKYNISDIKRMVTVAPIRDTNVIKIAVKGTNSKLVTNIANVLAFEMGARMEISDRSQTIVSANNRLLEIESLVEITQSEIDTAKEQLKSVPEKLETQKSLSTDAYLLSIAGESSSIDSKDLGAIQFSEEEINPTYLELQSSVATASLNLSKLVAEQNSIKKMNEQNQLKITELENQVDEASLKAQSSQRLLNGFQAVFISPALLPDEPTGPNKLFNVAIAAVLGLFISGIILFFKQYWKKGNGDADRGSVNL